MIAGHAPLAFAIVAGLAQATGRSSKRSLRLGLLAAGFAVVPDVDMLFAVIGLVGASPTGLWDAVEAFWTSSKLLHRGLTHSLTVGAVAVLGFVVATTPRGRWPAAGILGGLVGVGLVTSGLLGGLVMSLYVLAGATVVLVGIADGFGPREILLAATAGIGTHPFGDVFTGTPPLFFAPFGRGLIVERIVLHPDPTLNLLAIFGLELLCLWSAVVIGADLVGWSMTADIDWRAVAGAGYGVTAVLMPAPTLDVSYHFVFSVLAVGSVGVAPLSSRVTPHPFRAAVVTGLAAVSLGALAYTGVYLLA